MTLFLLFVSAQLFGTGDACLNAAVAWHFTRPRLAAGIAAELGKAPSC